MKMIRMRCAVCGAEHHDEKHAAFGVVVENAIARGWFSRPRRASTFDLCPRCFEEVTEERVVPPQEFAVVFSGDPRVIVAGDRVVLQDLGYRVGDMVRAFAAEPLSDADLPLRQFEIVSVEKRESGKVLIGVAIAEKEANRGNGWLRCEVCGCVVSDGHEAYRVCDRQRANGRDCKLVPCGDPASPERVETCGQCRRPMPKSADGRAICKNAIHTGRLYCEPADSGAAAGSATLSDAVKSASALVSISLVERRVRARVERNAGSGGGPGSVGERAYLLALVSAAHALFPFAEIASHAEAGGDPQVDVRKSDCDVALATLRAIEDLLA